MSQDIALKTNNYFNPSQVTELLLGIALFHGFSKMLIALGREPSDMDTVVIPTPAAPTNSLNIDYPETNPMYRILSPSTNLRDRWLHFEDALWKSDSCPSEILEILRSRLAELLTLPNDFSEYYHTDSRNSSLAPIADQFFFDVRSISEEQRSSIVGKIGLDGLLNLMICLALYDGAFRVISTISSLETLLDINDTINPSDL